MIEAIAAGLRRIQPKKPEALLYIGDCIPLNPVCGIPVIKAEGLYYEETGAVTVNPVNYIPIGDGILMLERVKFAQAADDKGGAE